MNRNLLLVTALLEAGTGIALLAAPSWVASLLLGTGIDAPAGLTVARIGGAALLAIGVLCWMARDNGQSAAGRAVLMALLVYNVAVVALFTQSGLTQGLVGILLWPAVAVHTVLAVWCIASLQRKNRGPINRKLET